MFYLDATAGCDRGEGLNALSIDFEACGGVHTPLFEQQPARGHILLGRNSGLPEPCKSINTMEVEILIFVRILASLALLTHLDSGMCFDWRTPPPHDVCTIIPRFPK